MGPVFGSVVYQLSGKESVFLVLAGFTVILALIQVLVWGLSVQRHPPVSYFSYVTVFSYVLQNIVVQPCFMFETF